MERMENDARCAALPLLARHAAGALLLLTARGVRLRGAGRTLLRRLLAAAVAVGNVFGLNGRIELGQRGVGQAIPHLVFAEQWNAEIAAHRQLVAARTDR